jgi:hypothetical protein
MTSGGTTTWKDVLVVDGEMIATRHKVVSGSTDYHWWYYLKDSLGSVVTALVLEECCSTTDVSPENSSSLG